MKQGESWCQWCGVTHSKAYLGYSSLGLRVCEGCSGEAHLATLETISAGVLWWSTG